MLSIRNVWILLFSLGLLATTNVCAQTTKPEANVVMTFAERYCITCHNEAEKTSGIDLSKYNSVDPANDARVWESVVRKLAARQMPPSNAKTRPTERELETVLTQVTDTLDRFASTHPNPGRTDTFRRLTRIEYQNAIRDLLNLDIDASAFLPADESSHGFDNITVSNLSPTLLDRYITASQKISRLAVGISSRTPGGDTFRVRADLTQEEHVEGLPIGTRGGILIDYVFVRDGDYEISLRLTRDRNEHVEGLREAHQVEILIDRNRVALFNIEPPRSEHDHEIADQHLHARVKVSAGPHKVGVTFLKKPSSLLETKRQPHQAHYNMHRHPRLSPALFQTSITGPYDSKAAGESPSRRQIFTSYPKNAESEEQIARAILTRLTRRAFRRPVTDDDLAKPMAFYRLWRSEHGGSFDTGIEAALSSILVSPKFLFKIERDPKNMASHSAYRISEFELATRLSFFLWSSLPDDDLLELAEKGNLSKPEVLDQQVKRMLADRRSNSLVTNFADQWLHLRNLDSTTPDLRLFPDFDDNLRQAFRRETELLFASIVDEDRSVLDLIKPGYTFLNERLANHYDIPGIQGSRFRRIDLDAKAVRGGLLRQGSVLTVTSYATRTSPVIRGKWILENILGTPPPPPPANVPALKDNTIDATLSVRERLAEHRKNVACAGCHRLMDPVGFSLENFDAVGRWREFEEGRPTDSAGGMPDGSQFQGVAGLEAAILQRPELFAGTIVEKLLTYGLGRVVDSADGPAIRKIVRDARSSKYRFSSLITGIVTSIPFQMRISE
jgi:hypothetical protein